MVRAKFECYGMEKVKGYGDHPFHYNYRFGAVTSGSDENRSFFASTPSGELKLQAVKADLFEVGKQYYIDFELAG